MNTNLRQRQKKLRPGLGLGINAVPGFTVNTAACPAGTSVPKSNPAVRNRRIRLVGWSGEIKKRPPCRQCRAASSARTVYGPQDQWTGMGDYTTAIWVTIGLTVILTVPVVWQFLQPNDDDFGDLTRRK